MTYIIRIEQWDGSFITLRDKSGKVKRWSSESEALSYAHKNALVGYRVVDEQASK